MTLNAERAEQLSAGHNGATEFVIALLLERLCHSSLNDDDDEVAELSILLRHALQNGSNFHN